MQSDIEITGFPTYEQAKAAVHKLEAFSIPCRLASDRGGMFTTLHVEAEHAEQARSILEGEGIDSAPLPDTSNLTPADTQEDSEKSVPNDLTAQVVAELETVRTKQKNPLQQLGTLAVTILVFMGLGLFNQSISGILMLVGVLLIHELGHFISMKLLKYKDLQMFFIPLFGAAVSGTATAPSGLKKAIVSLMGPAPGIIFGLVAGVIYLKTSQPLLAEFAVTSLFLNVFNLLPFHPLDGGRFFEAILFSRHPRLELVFKILTTLALGGIALLLKAPLLGVFVLLSFSALKTTYSVARVAHIYRKKAYPADCGHADEIPPKHLHIILPLLKESVPTTQHAPKLLASHAQNVWQRICNRPCPVAASIGLTIGHAGLLFLGICGFFVFSWASYAANTNSEIITQTLPDGTTQRYELTSDGTNRFQRFEINAENLFHGEQLDWHPYTDQISKRGQWTNGYRTGLFELYDQNGNLSGTISYEHGTPVSHQIMENGNLVEVPPENWPTAPRHFNAQTKPVRANRSP